MAKKEKDNLEKNKKIKINVTGVKEYKEKSIKNNKELIGLRDKIIPKAFNKKKL